MKALWDTVDMPQYLFEVLYAAEQGRREEHSAISAIEFGVAEGYGLLTLQNHAAGVERHTGIRVCVYGFDTGTRLLEVRLTTVTILTYGNYATTRWTSRCFEIN